MDENKILIELDAKLDGIVFLCGRLLHLATKHIPDDEFEALAQSYIYEVSIMPSPGDDPTMADHKAATAASQVSRGLHFVRHLRKLEHLKS